MANITFSPREALRFGWNTTKVHWRFLAWATLAVGLASSVPKAIAKKLKHADHDVLGFAVSVLGWILYVTFELGFIHASLKFASGLKGEFEDFFPTFQTFWRYFVASLLYGLIVIGGLVLLVIPGVIWAIKFQFYPYFILDKNMRPKEALKASARITSGVKWELFLFGLLLIGIVLLGALAFVVGLFFAVPTAMLAMSFVYRRLLERSENVSPVS